MLSRCWPQLLIDVVVQASSTPSRRRDVAAIGLSERE